MKKLFGKITSLILVIAMSIGFLSGCELISTDAEKDMALVVATVSIDDGLTDTIYKKDLVSEFNSNAYLYMYYYGYTQKQTYEEILKGLVQDRIILQQSKKALTGATDMPGNTKGYFEQAKLVPEAERTSEEKTLTIKDFSTVKKTDSLDKFLTDYEIAQAKYNVLVSIDSLIKEYIDEDEDEKEYKYESPAITSRATLTIESDKTGNEWELQYDDEIKVVTESFKNNLQKTLDELNISVSSDDTKYSLNKKVYDKYLEKFNENIQTKKYRRALNKVMKDLKNSGYITSSEAKKTITSADGDNGILNISFFNDTLVRQYESLVISKYELALTNQEKKNINKEGVLYSEYVSLYQSQKASYENDYATYETALEGAGKNTFILYNPNVNGDKYGYISNLLIGFTQEQSTALENFSSKQNITSEEISEYRKSLLLELKAKDMRESWALSKYGTYDAQTGKFTFKQEYCPTESLREFKGVFQGAKEYTYLDSANKEVTAYSFKGVTPTEISFNDFYNDIVKTTMGFTGLEGKLENAFDETTVSTVIKDDLMKKYRDLIYAYSTDGGSLAENYGYLYSPYTSKTKYVEEYAEASKELVNKGVGAYKVVATKFGYHIMLCTSVLTPNTTMLTSEAFENQLLDKNSLAYKFKQYKISLVTSSRINDITNAFINGNYNDDDSKSDTDKVDYNVKAYEDLLVE